MSEFRPHPLLWALSISLLLHALLLSAVARQQPLLQQMPGAVIRAMLHDPLPAADKAALPVRETAPAALPAPVPASAPAPAAAIKPKPASRKNSAPQLAVRKNSSPQPVAPASTGSSPSQESPVSGAENRKTGSAEAAAIQDSHASTSPSSGHEAREGPSANELRQYILSLGAAARRFKRYPPLARERGWEGTVELAVGLRRALPAPEITLLRSSGRKLLDEQALLTLEQAANSVALPESLRGRDLRLPLTIQFSLEDEAGAAR